jgi:hypothetical protein
MMRPCSVIGQSNRRRKRSIQRESVIQPQKDIEVDVPLSNMETLVVVNTTTNDKYGMLYHTFNISTTDPLPVYIAFSPSVDGMMMYAQTGSLPTATSYQWTSDGNVSLFLTSEDVKNENGTLCIGVGFQGRRLPHWFDFCLTYKAPLSSSHC